MTRGDRILLVALAVAALLFTPVALAVAGGSTARTATITGPAGTTTVSLDEPRRLVVEGLESDVVVVVSNGRVRVERSGCPDQTCVRCGATAVPGAVIVCIPNGVSVTVGGDDSAAPDVIVR
ncbi:MAG: NusG domain II-containing protein [Coriobacteriia bacterium]